MDVIALLLLAIVPLDLPASEAVDAVERNWITNDDGEQMHLCQLIFYDIHEQTGERMIRGWRIVECEHGEYEGFRWAAAKSPHLGKRMVWLDRGTLRDIRVGYTTETVTPFDVEERARRDFPPSWRRELVDGQRAKSRARGR